MPQQNANYLESKVLTAPPHRLHLMLLEGAIRFARQAQEALARGEEPASSAALLRVIDIMGELLAGVRAGKTDLNNRVADLYWFVFRRVSEAKIHSDAAALADVLRILEYERQTWQLVCERLTDAGHSPIPAAAAVPPQIDAPGLSLEA